MGSLSLSEELIDLYTKLLDAPNIPPAGSPPIHFVTQLARLHNEPFLITWSDTLPATAQTILPIDLNNDDQPKLLVACRNGHIISYGPSDNPWRWQRLADTQLPQNAGPIVGFQVHTTPFSSSQAIHVITRGTNADTTYELFFPTPNTLTHQARPPRPGSDRHLVLGQSFGPRQADGFFYAAVMEHDQAAMLQGTSLLGQKASHPLPGWPFALVHTAHHIWVGDSRELVCCWTWEQAQLRPHSDWPASGLAVDGRVTALTLWPVPNSSADEFYLLIATDERWLFVASTTGREIARIPVPDIITALTTDPAGQGLFAAFEDGHLCRLQPIWPPLAQPQFPNAPTAINRLPEPMRTQLLQTWFTGDDEHRIPAGIAAFLSPSPTPENVATLEKLLASLNFKHSRAPGYILQALEPYALAADNVNAPVVQSYLRLARRWQTHISPGGSRRIELLPARLAARFRAEISANPDYDQLRYLRRLGDLALAQTYVREAVEATTPAGKQEKLILALTLYAGMLIDRQQIRWVFATNRAIRTLTILPAPNQALLATRGGHIYRLDLARPGLVGEWSLPFGDIPRALAIGRLEDEQEYAVAIATAQGHLYIGPADPERCLQELQHVHDVRHDVWSLAIIPKSEGQPPRFVISRGGSLVIYHRPGPDNWQPQPAINVSAQWLHCLAVTSLVEGQTPVILAGGSLAGGRGVLHLLNVNGDLQDQFEFPGTVFDVRAVPQKDHREKRLAVACNDGYVYLLSIAGVRLWRYNVGRTARNLTDCDLDLDGHHEIIVGGEAERNMAIVLDIHGAVKWHIPSGAPVTHVASLQGDADPPLLLLVDMEQTLRAVHVTRPDQTHIHPVWQEAVRALETLAQLSDETPTALATTWLTDPPRTLLQGFAFYYLAEQVLQGDNAALDNLLQAKISGSRSANKRAYARMLVYLVVNSHADDAITARVRQRLVHLLQEPTSPKVVGIAALRQLMLPNHLRPGALPTWAPVLLEAAGHSEAEVQRAVLHALRALQPYLPDAANLDPAAWEILRKILEPNTDNDPWVQEDLAGLLRDLAPDKRTLWLLVHRALTELTEPAILSILGQESSPLLDSAPLAAAITCLCQVSMATDASVAGLNLRQLTEAWKGVDFIPAEDTPAGDVSAEDISAEDTSAEDMVNDLLALYHLLDQGIQLGNYDEWSRYILDRLPWGGFGQLTEKLLAARFLDAQYNPQGDLRRITDIVQRYATTTPPSADGLSRLVEQLSQLTQRLANLQGTIRNGRHAPPLLARLLAGLLWAWHRPEGPLQRQLEELTRPAELFIEPVQAIRRHDEIILDINLGNSGYSEAIEELSIRWQQATLEYDNQTLKCQPTSASPLDGLTLSPQEKRPLQLRATLPPQAAPRPGHADPPATLHLPVRYFRPPKDWEDQHLQAAFGSARHIARATLDWEANLPRTAQAIQRRLNHLLRTAATRPVLIEASPFTRRGLIDALRRQARQGQPPPIIDMHQWLYVQNSMKAQQLQADEATFLAWLAEQIWPGAGTRANIIRAAGAPRLAFEELTRADATPEFIVLNNWERLLHYVALSGSDWQPLDDVVPYLIQWAQKKHIGLVLLGTFWAEQVTTHRWPQLAGKLECLRADQTDQNDPRIQAELVTAFTQLLDARQLTPTLSRFNTAVTPTSLVQLCGGYLHFLEFVCLEGLEKLREEPQRQPGDWLRYFLSFARQTNFFNSLWLWQDFFDRLAIILVAYGEIPLQERGWAEPGLTLSRDYFSRRPTGQPTHSATLAANQRLAEQDVVTIRSNLYYRHQDAWVQGFDLARPLPEHWGPAGEMLLQLLRAGGGEQRLYKLAQTGILRRRRTTHLGEFYEVSVPLYGHWLRQSGILNHILTAAQSSQESWYPADLANDQRPRPERNQVLLFSECKPGTAHRDIPLADLPAINQALNRTTRPLFINLYGLSKRGQTDPAGRLQALVQLATVINAQNDPTDGPPLGADDIRPLFDSLGTLLNLHLERQEAPTVQSLGSDQASISLAWTFATLVHTAKALHKQLLLLVIQDGKQAAELASELRRWARQQLQQRHRQQEPDLQQQEFLEALEHSVVLGLIVRDAAEIRRVLPPGRGGPHFIFLDLAQLNELVIQPNPANALVNHAFKVIGRHSFSPYKLFGSLAGGSPLFVGREPELNRILTSLRTEDHALLGSRRIGKTSLLHALGYHLRQPTFATRVLTLQLRLRDSSREADFFGEIRNALRNAGHGDLAKDLYPRPGGDYNILRRALQTLVQQYDHPIVFLIDEIDGLYLWDRDRNEQRLFQFLRNALAQAEPRLCTFIMTGYRHIFLDRQQHGSVFYNFCYFHNFSSIQPDGVERLVAMLRDLNITIDDPDSVIRLIAHGTFAIPYYVQRTCDDLLRRADRQGQDRISPADAQAVLEQDIRQRLKTELWDELLSTVPPLAAGDNSWTSDDLPTQNLKTKIILLATMLELYQHKFHPEYAHAVRAQGPPIFTAADAIQHLNGLYPNLVPGTWPIVPAEVDRLLRPLTMTLALTPADTDFPAYCFPNDILPDVLYFYEQRGEMDLIGELDNLVNKLITRLAGGQR
ncbi:MAG: hypothetical protein H6988_09840 [Pseudomonadales bacterium]|nr:hypothetical protein [Pseudomonadales bacterium]